ncbi:MAG: hypothetical protein ACM34K_03135 [Bacillota bacterium]
MKLRFLLLLFFLTSSAAFSQWVPGDIENALSRIEQSLRRSSPSGFEDLLTNGMTLRLEDSLYHNISGIQALNVLSQYFENRKTVDFHYESPGAGKLIYSSNGKQDTVNVDIWLRRELGGPVVYAMNFSNYPIATIFFDIPKEKRKSDNKVSGK